MKYNIQHLLHRISLVLESVLAVILLLAICTSIVGIVVNTDVAALFNDSLTEESAIHHYLSIVSTVVLCVEFVNMLCTHTVDSVVEVVLMAIARQVIVSHPAPFETLLMVCSITLLFVARKFLFVRTLDAEHKHTHSLFSELWRVLIGHGDQVTREREQERIMERLEEAEAEAERLRVLVRVQNEGKAAAEETVCTTAGVS